MGAKTPSERLEQLLRLARAYRGWTRKQLAEALGRDSTRLVPESGNPKLDLVLDLAKVMDWPVEDVAGYLSPGSPSSSAGSKALSFDDASKLSLSSYRDGKYREAVDLARQALILATNGQERAIAAVREASGWDGLGRYTKAMEATRRGLSETGVEAKTQINLETNLAIEHYTLWQLVEAIAIAHYLIDRYMPEPPKERFPLVSQAYAFYVRGHSNRRLIGPESESVGEHGARAKADLVRAIGAWEQLASKFDEASYLGVANTCKGGLLETEAALGERDPSEALAIIVSALDDLTDREPYPTGDELESYGWWCVFGCNIALRHLEDQRDLQQKMAVFTNKADEIAVQLDNWSLRERVFTMDFERRQRFADWTGMDADWTIDRDDLRLITGTMGRFPRFQETGWHLIQSSKIVN